MSKKEKLIARMRQIPKDFTFDELKAAMKVFGYTLDEGRSGSRISFINEETNRSIILHKPHPGNIMKSYQLQQVIDHLKEVNLL